MTDIEDDLWHRLEIEDDLEGHRLEGRDLLLELENYRRRLELSCQDTRRP